MATHNDKLLTQDDVAEMLGVKAATLSVWRSAGRYDLPFIRVGRCIRYRAEDVERFIEANTVTTGDAK